MTRLAIVLLLAGCTAAPVPKPKPVPQNPSPVTESTRAHERVQRAGTSTPRKPLEVRPGTGADLLIHFHGAAWLPMQVAPPHLTVAAVNLGSGSGVYERAYTDASAFPQLVASLDRKFERVYVSGFSAGYGAIRALLRAHADSIDGVLLLDGLHTSYVPDGKPGPLDASKLDPFIAFARRAVAGEKTFVFTHSEVFPGTYASTTECADFILASLGLERTPVLKWGPGGMQQLSEVRSGRFVVLGFAGNSAPDHVDHLHGMGVFVRELF